MDELDLKIIAILQSDGRASNAKIARAAGVSEGTVRRRMRRLIDEDIVQVIAVPNLEKMGYGTTALIGLETGPGKSDAVAESIANLAEAHYVVVATGPYDVFVWTALESAESLGDFLRTRIGTIEGVQKTQTFVTLSTKNASPASNPPAFPIRACGHSTRHSGASRNLTCAEPRFPGPTTPKEPPPAASQPGCIKPPPCYNSASR